jgi:anaerobic magnesium-protoporphyrin IX monomethyl ester cyclase
MDAVLINPRAYGQGINYSTILPPIGLGYIASFLIKNNYICKIIDQNISRLPDMDLISEIPEDTYIIGIYLNSFLYDAVLKMTRLIREHRKKTYIILGGPLPTARPEMILQEIECDGLIRGEGEYAFNTLLQNITQSRPLFAGDVSGAVYYDAAGSIVQRPIKRILDLDELPFPAYELIPALRDYRSRSRKTPSAPIITSRGCPFQCTFCSKAVYNQQVTYRSSQNVLAEIDHLVKSHKVKQLDIIDDNFASNSERLHEILDGIIARKYDLVLNIQLGIRTEILDKNILVKMKKAGIFKLAFGVESGDENLLKIHKKNLN